MTTFTRNPPLLLTLGVALIQGALLYFLHQRISSMGMPALATLYSLSLFVPLTLQLLSAHWRKPVLWMIAGGLALCFAYFGWHFGSQVELMGAGKDSDERMRIVYLLSLIVLWLLAMPFLQCRLTLDRWRCDYAQLFSASWQIVIQLAEAAVFTGVFWLLLGLWAVLFKMLGYSIFKELFTATAFIYPFTAVTFGAALFLTGSVERLVTVTREQILGLLKWLAPVAALILALFTPTLIFKLPDLVLHGERAIGATWLLWLLAVTVLLLNAGYQNGTLEKPYPRVLAVALRCVIPAMVVVSLTALYALIVRSAEYGISVARVFAFIVALTGLGYAVGYTLAAIKRGPWLQGIERVNIGVSLGLIAALTLTLTPIASPYRLAASSQASRALFSQGADREAALRYLRFDSGRYGLEALSELKSGDIEGVTAELKRDAETMLAVANVWEATHTVSSDVAVDQMAVYPTDHKMPAALLALVRQQVAANGFGNNPAAKPVALFIDLNEDSQEECAVLGSSRALLFTFSKGLWSSVNEHDTTFGGFDAETLRNALEAGDFGTYRRSWSDLRIGNRVLRWKLADESLPDVTPEATHEESLEDESADP